MLVPGQVDARSAPATAVYGGNLLVFVRGPGGTVWQNAFSLTSMTTGTWSGWSELPGRAKARSAPATAVYGGNLLVFVRGPKGTIRQNAYTLTSMTTGTWATWSRIVGAEARSAPAAALGGGSLMLFVRGPFGTVRWNSTSLSTSWAGWTQFPGDAQARSRPEPMNSRILVRGPAGTVRVSSYVPSTGTWTDWSQLAGDAVARSALAGAAYGPWTWLFVRGTGGVYYRSLA